MTKTSFKDIKLTKQEKKKYLLPENRDFEILAKCKKLEKLPLSKTDQKLIKLIKSQLEKDWRRPLLTILNNLSHKYVSK